MTPLEIFMVAWTTGAIVTYRARVRKISTSSPAAAMALTYFVWPVFWIGH